MTLSINTPAFVKFDTTPMATPAALAMNASGSAVPTSSSQAAPIAPRQDALQVPQGNVTISASSLSKLFDMLEQMFKTMREMFAGKDITPDVLPGADKVPKLKVDGADQPKVKVDIGLLPKVKVDGADQSKVKADVGLLPKVKVDGADQPKIKVDIDLSPKVKVDGADQAKVKPDTGLLPKVMPDKA
ncbi:hypothetical protein F0169_25990, partial [Pseudomonas sp. MAFF 212408]|nr:hypothetical protein [Pseudomonas kitaguniensis]